MTKIAIVTGSSGNLGLAVTKKLIGDGYHVSGTVTPNYNGELELPASQFEEFPVDLMEEEAAHRFVSAVIAKQKSLDLAVLTVGGFAMGKMADTSSKQILQQYRLNFETAYHVAQPAFLQMMKQGSGRIFLVGSRPGMEAAAGKSAIGYALAKSLLFRLAEIVNAEAKGKDVVTSVIVPSTIDTPENRKAMPDADVSKWVRPEDIASVISFYASKEASAIREPILKVYGNT